MLILKKAIRYFTQKKFLLLQVHFLPAAIGVKPVGAKPPSFCWKLLAVMSESCYKHMMIPDCLIDCSSIQQ